MAERVMYQPTEKQATIWGDPANGYEAKMAQFPDDAHWKSVAGRKPWGIVKRDAVLAVLKASSEYQMGLWQGRVDAAQDLDYSEERNDSAYNLGYYTGYTEFASNYRGWDRDTRARFDALYRRQEA